MILPEPDTGIRKGMDDVVRSSGLLNKLDIALEVGGWATILAYVRDGCGVGSVSEGALDETKGFTIRPLDRTAFAPIEARLICRHLGGSGDELDLSEAGANWRLCLTRSVTPKR